MTATATLAGCTQGNTYLVDAQGDFIQPSVVVQDAGFVTGYFACGSPGRSCRAQAQEACDRYDMNVGSVDPMDVTIPAEPTGFNYFPIVPNRKVTCTQPMEATR